MGLSLILGLKIHFLKNYFLQSLLQSSKQHIPFGRILEFLTFTNFVLLCNIYPCTLLMSIANCSLYMKEKLFSKVFPCMGNMCMKLAFDKIFPSWNEKLFGQTDGQSGIPTYLISDMGNSEIMASQIRGEKREGLGFFFFILCSQGTFRVTFLPHSQTICFQ